MYWNNHKTRMPRQVGTTTQKAPGNVDTLLAELSMSYVQKKTQRKSKWLSKLINAANSHIAYNPPATCNVSYAPDELKVMY